MNTVDKISREAKLILDATKDSVINNIITASRSGTFQIEDSQLARLVQVVTLSFDDSTQKSLPHFQNSIKNLVKK
jgi:hypothetical protein